ncbi:LPS export ABC transporter periplasmic protein LptC [Desulfobotulus sp.]|jgi:LPS export ABC transporter protein LptC|uniref:LPS export ABC transporter periplasmic protein LptC n=1 Tax=Desulfobotulus sp. TaxID=1940337 RepID=UPI002A35A774|nr:LPS export ABC transporter periplasmic protein LptC [Desulfobotulus sp.]MDY0163887.1 LPS export ABC transporter periplasmic protein LptC [Desulfobotulus sp.]
MTPFRRKRIFFMLFALGLILVTLLLFLVEYLTAPPAAPTSLQRTDISLSRFRHTATEKERILWTLSADRADYDRQAGMVEMTGVMVTYISEDHTPLTARSHKGLADVNAKDVRLTEKVEVTHPLYLLESEALLYASDTQVLASPVKTRVTGTQFQMEADAASYELPSGVLRLTGQVKGVLHAPMSSP